MNRNKLSKENTTCTISGENGYQPGGGMELSPGFKEISRFFKSLTLNGIKGVVTSGQGYNQLTLQPMRRKGLEDFLHLKNNFRRHFRRMKFKEEVNFQPLPFLQTGEFVRIDHMVKKDIRVKGLQTLSP